MPIGPSLHSSASVTGPGAGAAIVTIPNVQAGFYHAEIVVSLTGTMTAAETNNVRLVVPATGGGTKNWTTLPTIGVANATPPLIEIYRLQIDANGPVSINAVGAAGAAAVYFALLILDPLVN